MSPSPLRLCLLVFLTSSAHAEFTVERKAAKELSSSIQKPLQSLGERLGGELRMAILPSSNQTDSACEFAGIRETVFLDSLYSGVLEHNPDVHLIEKSELATVVDNLKMELDSGLYDTRSLAVAGKQLGASVVLACKLTCDKDEVMISGHLVHVETGRVLAAPQVPVSLEKIQEQETKAPAKTTLFERHTDRGGFTKEDRRESERLYFEGTQYMEGLRYGLALEFFKKSWNVMPTAETGNAAGELCLKSRYYKQAAEWFRAVLDLEPDYRPAKVNLALTKEEYRKAKARKTAR